eukprot:TRINITY_DN40869_c0_g1_i1.p1 TRINITY_DN40869_c0_g1~~TRINITY_DN40869_c0_g1_i1.p1  ORF type:complete len:813 (-),score=96.32 TRINITY_DN40869_c0_g1_i1:196-2559(-)
MTASVTSQDLDDPDLEELDTLGFGCYSEEIDLRSLLQIMRRSSHPRLQESLQRLSKNKAESVRGVPLDVAMEGFGRHFRKAKAEAEDFDKSCRVEIIHDFLSHSWAIDGFTKTTTLHWLYDFNTSMFVSTFIVALVSLIQFRIGVQPLDGNMYLRSESEAVKPNGYPVGFGCEFIAPMAFFLLMFKLRKFMSLLQHCVGRRRIFFDKLCVHQTDTGLKEEGILAIGNSIEASQRLVILWSPEYFTKLWCIFEFAAWMHLKGESAKPPRFVPVRLACTMACWGIMAMVNNIALRIFWYFASARMYYSANEFLLSGYIVVVCWLIVHSARYACQEISEIDAQLQIFNIHDASTYCCDNDHMDPDTKAELVCDRELIYATLAIWYAQSGLSDEEVSLNTLKLAIDDFQFKVQGEMRTRVEAMSRDLIIQFGYKRVVATILPYSWFWLDEIPAMWQFSPTKAVEWGLHGFAMTFLYVPCILTFAWSFIEQYAHPSGQVQPNKPEELIVSLLFAIIIGGSLALCRTASSHFVSYDYSVFVQSCWYAGFAIATFVVFHRAELMAKFFPPKEHHTEASIKTGPVRASVWNNGSKSDNDFGRRLSSRIASHPFGLGNNISDKSPPMSEDSGALENGGASSLFVATGSYGGRAQPDNRARTAATSSGGSHSSRAQRPVRSQDQASDDGRRPQSVGDPAQRGGGKAKFLPGVEGPSRGGKPTTLPGVQDPSGIAIVVEGANSTEASTGPSPGASPKVADEDTGQVCVRESSNVFAPATPADAPHAAPSLRPPTSTRL